MDCSVQKFSYTIPKFYKAYDANQFFLRATSTLIWQY
jgi:hypothetical protein